MSLASRNSNRKSKSHNQMNRVMFFDSLEDRRLMAGLNGYMVGRAYFKSIPAAPVAEVAPAAKMTASTAGFAAAGAEAAAAGSEFAAARAGYAAAGAEAIAQLATFSDSRPTVELFAETFGLEPLPEVQFEITPEIAPRFVEPADLAVAEATPELPTTSESDDAGLLIEETISPNFPGVIEVTPEYIPHPAPEVDDVVMPEVTREVRADDEIFNVTTYSWTPDLSDLEVTVQINPERRADLEVFTGTTYLYQPDLSGATVVLTLNPEVTGSSTSTVAADSPLFGVKMPELGGDEPEAGTFTVETHLIELQNTKLTATGDYGAASYSGTTHVLSTSGTITLEDDFTKGKVSVKAEADASLFKTSHTGNYAAPILMVGGQEVSSTTAKGTGTVMVGVSGSIYGSLAGNGTEAGVKMGSEVFAGIQANGDGVVENRTLGVKSTGGGNGSARAGVEATTEVIATGKDGFKAEVGAFAGAKAGGEVSASIGGVGVNVGGEAWAGAGYTGEVKSVWKDGKLKIETELGLALGVGGKVDFGFELDFSEIVKLGDVPQQVSQFFTSITTSPGFQSFADSFNSVIGTATTEVVSGWNTVNTEVANASSVAINTVANSFVMPGLEFFRGSAGSVVSAHDHVFSELGNFGSQVNNAINQGISHVNQAANEMGNVASQAANEVGNVFSAALNSIFG